MRAIVGSDAMRVARSSSLRRRRARAALCTWAVCVACLARDVRAADSEPRLDALAQSHPAAVARARAAFEPAERVRRPAAYATAALSAAYPNFDAALQRYDAGDWSAARAAFATLRDGADPLLADAALYYAARCLARQGATGQLATLLEDSRDDSSSETAFTPGLRLLRAHAAARNLQYEAAAAHLQMLAETPDAPEPVVVAAEQFRIELSRRATGPLAEAGDLMGYVADRLALRNADDDVRRRQERIVDLLDELIDEAEQREQQQQQQASAQMQPGPQGAEPGAPQQPAAESTERVGRGEIGALHAAPAVQPGEAWGALPPQQRDAVLENLRARYPARYRQLVEQYYRSLAEQP